MRSQVKFSGQVEPGADLVRSPVTDQPCVYWRLRIVERLTVGSELVHEMASSQAFRLLWGARDGIAAPVRVLVEPDARPHRSDADAAPPRIAGRAGRGAGVRFSGRAVGRGDLGTAGRRARRGRDAVRSAGTSAGPFRTAVREPELVDATLTLATTAWARRCCPGPSARRPRCWAASASRPGRSGTITRCTRRRSDVRGPRAHLPRTPAVPAPARRP